MKYLLLSFLTFSLSFQLFGQSCTSAYQKVAKQYKHSKKDTAAGVLVLGGVSSSAAIVSSGVGGPGLMVAGLSSFYAGEYLSGNREEIRQETHAILSLLKDAKLEKGYYLTDATKMIRNLFQDQSITEKEVAKTIKKQNSNGLYCKNTKNLMGLSSILNNVGKSIIAERALSRGRNIYNKSRNFHEDKGSHEEQLDKKIPSQSEDR